MSPPKAITVKAVFDLFIESSTIQLIDVRETDEFAECSASHSRNIPLSQLSIANAAEFLAVDLQEPIHVICRSGRRSEAACIIFSDAGFTSVFNVKGGMEAWQKLNLPVRCSSQSSTDRAHKKY